MLLASILRRAAFDIALYKEDSRLLSRRVAISAYNWMFFDDLDSLPEIDRFTSFRNICEILDRDPEDIRDKTLQMTRADVKKFDRVGL